MSLRTISVALCIIVFVLAMASINYAAEKKEHQYVGVTLCKGCHSNEKVGGTEYNVWKDKMHAGAYTSLASDHAKEVATKAGVEGDPQKADACLKCHITAFGVKADLLAKTYKKEDGVACEACHGPGKDYMPLNVMKDHDAAVAAGLAKIDEKTCTACHNADSPTYKEFKLKEFMDAIKHWD